MSSSDASAAVSTNFSRHFLASAINSAGTSLASNFMPCVLSSQ